MVATMSKLHHVSRIILQKYTKFRVPIDENNEATYWTLICRQPYQDMLLTCITEKAVELWDNHSCVIPYWKHVSWQRLSKGVYVEHSKHAMEMICVALFEEFQETNLDVEITINMSDKLKPWYIRPNTTHDIFCCWYHVEFQLYYDTFIEFCRRDW